MTVDFSARSKKELAQIGDWIGRDSPVRASTFVQELIDACESLIDFPRSYSRLEGSYRRAIRKKRYGAYLILFEIRGSRIRIVAIVHSARDFTKSL